MNSEAPPVWWQILADVLIILGAVAVTVLAVFGGWFRSTFAGPKLLLEPHNLKGHKAKNARGRLMIFYHLHVKNLRHWAPAEGVRVLLKRFERRGPDNEFHEEAVTIPRQFCWSPAETSAVVQTIADERIFDLGFLFKPDANGNTAFQPRWYEQPFKQDYLVDAGQAVRYHLEIVGENFHCRKTFGFEVAWDGQWSEDLDELQNHLRIRPL